MTTYGDCIVTRTPGGIRVDQADDHIRVSRQLIDAEDLDKNVTIADGCLVIDATNGRYVYKLGPIVDYLDDVTADLVYAS